MSVTGSAQRRSRVCSPRRSPSTLGLSATPERAGDYGMEERVFPSLGEVVFRYTHADGLADGVIADFGVAFIGVDLTAGERREYERVNDRVADALNHLLESHWNLRGIDDRREFFAAIQMLVKREDPAAEAFMAAVGKRSGIVISAARRLELVQWLFEQARPAGKALLFHERIESCEELAEALAEMGVPAAAHHSELSSVERRSVLDAFAGGRTQVLVAPRTLDEGIDVPDAEVAIIVSGSSVGRQAIQRIGRVLRPAPGKGFARIGLIYARGCHDDPRASESLDGLAAAMEEMERAWWFEGARDRAAIGAFFTAERLPEWRAHAQTPPGASAAPQHRQVRSEPRELDAPPTFAETRSQIRRLRRLSGANQATLRRRLERRVKDRVSWELERIMQLPSEEARSQLIRLSRRATRSWRRSTRPHRAGSPALVTSTSRRAGGSSALVDARRELGPAREREPDDRAVRDRLDRILHSDVLDGSDGAVPGEGVARRSVELPALEGGCGDPESGALPWERRLARDVSRPAVGCDDAAVEDRTDPVPPGLDEVEDRGLHPLHHLNGLAAAHDHVLDMRRLDVRARHVREIPDLPRPDRVILVQVPTVASEETQAATRLHVDAADADPVSAHPRPRDDEHPHGTRCSTTAPASSSTDARSDRWHAAGSRSTQKRQTGRVPAVSARKARASKLARCSVA